MPVISDAQMQRLVDDNVGWIVLLGLSREQIRAGEDALLARGVTITYGKVHTLDAPGYRVFVDVLRVTPPGTAGV